jgi:ABC-type amino acid transport substrate-binding protein
MREGSRPELVVGIDRAQPIPMQMGSPETGDLRGFEVELLNAIADDLGRNIVYRTEDWSVLMARLSAGDLDIICSAATVSAERSEQVAFCTPHLKISLALVNRLNGHLVPFLREARIGVRQGTTAERYAERNYTSSELSMISESNEELYLALAHGQLDAVIDDSPIALHFSQTIEGLEYRGPLDGTDGEYAIMTVFIMLDLRSRSTRL